MNAGRFFLHEHPWGAWSWCLPEVKELLNETSVKLAKGNMCAQGMKLRDQLGEAPVLKATGWMSNSDFILQELSAKCTNNGGPKDQTLQPAEQPRCTSGDLARKVVLFDPPGT